MRPTATEVHGPAMRPRVSDVVMTVQAGDDLFVYDAVTGRLQRLNQSARLVLERCNGAAMRGEIVSELAALYAGSDGAGTADVEAQVDAIIDGFAAGGLLAGAELAPPSPVSPNAARRAVVRHPPDAPPLRVLGPYRALDSSLVIECHHSVELADELDDVLHPLRIASTPPGPVERFVVWHDDGWRMNAAGNDFHAADASVIVDFVMWQLNHLAFERSPRLLVLHAGVVARDGRALVLPGAANRGKSTLVTALLAAGYDYLSDEAAAIDLVSGEVVAHPKPVGLDPGTQRLFAHLDPQRLPGTSSKWYVAPDAIGTGAVVERAAVGAIVFPDYQPGGDNVATELGLADAVEGVLSHAFNLAAHAGSLQRIVDLVERWPCYSLQHDGIEAPVAALRPLL